MAYFDAGAWQEENSPRWAADFRSRDHLVPGPVKLEAAQFPVTGTVVVTMDGAEIAGVTSLTVDPLPGAIPSGTLLDFSGTSEIVRTTALAAKGATEVPVEATDAAIEDNDTATYIPAGATKKTVRSGTAIGRTIAERDAKTGYGPASAADDEVYLLAFGVEDVGEDNAGVVYRPGSVVKENLLPEVIDGTMISGVLTKIRANYVCQGGLA